MTTMPAKPKSRVHVREDVLLGSNGSKWKHGWIPLNAVASAIKAKKFGKEGHSGKSRIDIAKQITHATAPSGKARAPRGSKSVAGVKMHSDVNGSTKGETSDEARTRIKAAMAQYNKPTGEGNRARATGHLPGPKSPLPEGRKVTAHEVIVGNGSMGEIRDAESGRIISSNHVSKRAAAVIANRHNLKTEQAAVAKDNDASRAKLKLEAALSSKGQLSPEHHNTISVERAAASRRIAGNASAVRNGSTQAVEATRQDKALQGRIARRVRKHVEALNAR